MFVSAGMAIAAMMLLGRDDTALSTPAPKQEKAVVQPISVKKTPVPKR